MASQSSGSVRRNWSLEELRVLAAIYFNSNFSIGDDARDECRAIADSFKRTPSSIDRQWRNLDAVLKGKQTYNVGQLVRQVATDYLADPVANRRLAIEVCQHMGWPLESLITGELPSQPLVVTSISNHGELMDYLRVFCDGLEYKLFKTGSQGFVNQGEFQLADGRRYQAQVSAILIGSKDDIAVKLLAKRIEISDAVSTVLSKIQSYTFNTGRIGYHGSGKCSVGDERFHVVIEAVQIGDQQ